MDLSKADKMVRNARYKEGAGDISLGGSMSLRVAKNGTKTLSFRAKLHGKPKRFPLGTYPACTVSQAFDRANELRSMTKTGLDPRIASARAREGADAPNTIAEAAARYIEQHVRHKLRPNWSKETERMLSSDVLPKLGSYTFKQLTKADLSNLISKKAEVSRKAGGKAISANRLAAVLSRFMRFCADHGWVAEAVGLRLPKPGKEQSRERVLTADELRHTWTTAQRLAEGKGASPAVYGHVISLLMLTGWRTSEITNLTKAAVNRELKTISVIVGKNKSSQRTVMLPPAAWIVIEARLGELELVPATALLFDQPNGGLIKSNEVSRAARRMPKLDGSAHWSPRDLRRTVISIMSEAGIDGDVRRRVTGHVATDIHGKVYDKSQRLRDGRDALLTVERMLFDGTGNIKQSSDNVVDLSNHAASVA